MAAATAWFAECGAREVRLEVFAWNEAAVACYRGLGFAVTELIMVRPLPPR